METMSRNELLCAIRQVNFVLYDLVLYLDTHPDCACGLSTYHEYKKEYDKMVHCYENKFGPLYSFSVENKNRWDWTDEPWPWQKECDC